MKKLQIALKKQQMKHNSGSYEANKNRNELCYD
jgi:hypothetical protein